MATPATYRRTTGPLPRTIEKVTETVPSTLAADEVLIRIHAVSLNFRDIGMLDGRYPLPSLDHGIPASDCAAEVIETGSEVKQFGAGDRVTNTIDLNNIVDEDESPFLALGGEIDGVLRRYAVFKEKHLLPIPDHLSWEEVRTLDMPPPTCMRLR
ncbi:putative secondary metabolism biosynthetic enzyme [Diplodia intermedia]|uniref:Secondary metabolism biosynthetic enzyme n=1 Tax=Diplodia intermedia TaxID=856260 RepID=A0ABR3TQX9_9PEZI